MGLPRKTMPGLLVQRLFAILLLLHTADVGVATSKWGCSGSNGAYVQYMDCTFGDEVSLNGDLSVTGREGNYTTLTAASGKRHFKITSGAHTLRLKWLNMTGGDVGTCDSDSCKGGSIHVKNAAAYLNISQCVFFKNRAFSGGAVYAFSNSGQPTLLFSYVLFESNSASAHGGAVLLYKGTSHGEWNTFKKNAAGLDGGAMYIVTASTVSSTDSSFIKNEAYKAGAGIYIRSDSSSPSQINLTRAQLIENKQTSGGSSTYHGGGGLYIEDNAVANIRECTLVRNEATSGGGGLKYGHQIMTRRDTSNVPSITIVNTNFTDLEASYRFYGYDGDDIDGGNPNGPEEYITPSACAARPCTVIPFDGDCYTRASDKQGVICDPPACPAGSYNQFLSTSLPPPLAIPCGETMPEYSCSQLPSRGVYKRTQDCTFGDEVSLSGDLSVTGKEGNYTTLTAASGKRHFKITSGAHTLALKWLNMTGGDVTSGLGCGGSIYIFRVAAHLNISRSVFFNNRADLGGAVYGAVYAEDARPTLLFSSVLVESNYAATSGGAVYLKAGTFSGESNIFQGNKAGVNEWTSTGSGGAMYIGANSTVLSTSSSYIKNTAQEMGGGIYITGSSTWPSHLNLTRVQIVTNNQTGGGGSITKGGGGLYLEWRVTVDIRECTFIRNVATTASAGGEGNGHQIMVFKFGDDIPSVTIVNTNFTDLAGSHPFYGFCHSMMVSGANEYVTPTNCTANPCTAIPFTGDCYASASQNQGVLCDPPACPAGSYNQFLSTSLPPPLAIPCGETMPEYSCSQLPSRGVYKRTQDCTFGDEVSLSGDLSVTGKEGNYTTLTAASGKRHFKITSGSHTLALKWLNMTGGDVTSGLGCGGSIYIFRVAAHLNISRSVFFNNRADLGGAVYAAAVYAEDARPTLLFSSVLVKSNYATDKGGGVYLQKGTFNGESNTFKKNTAGMGGGAMCVFYSTVSIIDSSYIKNTASRRGGGIVMKGDPTSPCQVNLTRVQLIENKQTQGGSTGGKGGGGLFLTLKSIVNIRECIFVRNEATTDSGEGKHGHQIMTNKVNGSVPIVMIINTKFLSVDGSFDFYGYDDDTDTDGADEYVTPTACVANPCTTLPFTNSCSARSNANHGVLCLSLLDCPAGHHDPPVNETSLPPPATCKICAAGTWSGAGRPCASCPTGRHIVDPGLNASLHDEEADCVAAEITGIHPNNQSTLGGTFTVFIGKNFGATAASTIRVWTSSRQQEWANVSFFNRTCITGVSPAGVGSNYPITIAVDGVMYVSTAVLFSYHRPNITHVIAPPFNGGTLQIFGTDFGEEASVETIIVFQINGCSSECTGVEMPTSGQVNCQYDKAGNFGATRTIALTTAGQTSDRATYTYDVDKGEITGIPAGLQIVTEMETVTYSIGLSNGLAPTATVVIHLLSSSTKPAFNCTVAPVNITIPANDNGTITPIVIKTNGNVIDEGTNAETYACSVVHTLETTDPQYATSPQRTVTVNVMNDDHADANLWIISDLADSYTYKVKLLSFYNLEGGSFQYGVRLDTEPRALVRINPQISLQNGESIVSPPVLSATPEYLVFDASNWSVHQRFVYSSLPDSTDNDLQVFEIAHSVLTDDEVFRAKSTIRPLKVVVNAADDDTAKLLVEAKQIVLAEGGDLETITISGLASKPTFDVNITIDSPSFITVLVSNPVIKRSKWNNCTRTIQLRAISGATPGVAVVRLQPRSADPKYNGTALGVSMDVIVLRATIPAVLGIPLLAKVNEGDSFSYEVKLSTVPSALVKIRVSSTCGVATELSFGDMAAVPMNVPTRRRAVATAKASVVGTCTLTHRVESSDPDYSSLPDQTLNIDIVSTGCGVGEYRGPFNRSNNGTECICGAKWYKPQTLDCAECPEKGLVCDRAGIKTPPVAKDFWRHNLESPDFVKYPLYECIIPESCVGGNSTKRRCAEGYNDSAPICAVCDKNYVFQQGVCSYCKGYVAGGITSPTPQMTTAALLCMFFGIAFLYYYFTLPALTREEENDLRIKLSTMDIESLFEKKKKLSLLPFSHLVDAELTDNEIAHIFRVIDKDKNGFISKIELIDYTTDDGTIDIDELQNHRKALSGKQKKTASAVSTMGTAMVKFKILLTYVQCMSFLPVVFELPFPETMTQMMKLLEFSSLDIYVVFGEVSCHMQTTFKQKFVFHMLLFPVICVCVCIVWGIIHFREKYLGKYYEPYFTRESMKTRLYTFGSLLAFGLYAGLSTKIFRLFKCKEVQERFYLVADYSVECYVGTWWNYGGVAILCMIIYVIGIPGIQFYVLWQNRHHLHETSALDQQSHRLVKKQFGSLYDNYTEDCFYFEMVNMFRKLMMTGGLILVGQESVVQALLGILTCTAWFGLVSAKFPYKAYWDNMLEIALSFGLLLSLISGFALELFRLKEADGYEQVTFDFLLVAMTCGGIFSGLFALVITLPFCRSRFIKYFMGGKVLTKRNFMKGWVTQHLPVLKWLPEEAIHEIMKSCGFKLEKEADRMIQHSHRKKRLSKIYPTKHKKISLDAIVKTNMLAKKRKKLLTIRKVMLPASAKKKKPTLKSLGIVVKEHVKSKFRQRRLHSMEVTRIHKDREEQSRHLKRKQEEMVVLKEKKRQQLERRIKSRKKV